jgi:hypothetical protein
VVSLQQINPGYATLAHGHWRVSAGVVLCSDTEMRQRVGGR